MPAFWIEVEKPDGTRDTLVRHFDHPEEARRALEKGEIDESSGLRIAYKVIRISAEPEERQAERRAVKAEILDKARTSGDWSDVPFEIIEELSGDIVLTTAPSVANRETEREIAIITAECVFGMNVFRDVFAAVRDVVGGRSAATQRVLREARRVALAELRREALTARADAVIGVELAYQELTGGGKGGMIMIVASGTAVALRPIFR